MRLKFIKLISILFLFLIFTCYSGYGSSTKKEGGHIDIIFTGEESGYLEPCGCAEGQMGGMKRRYEFLKTVDNDGRLVLPISLGDLPGMTNRQNEIKAEIMLRAMDMMNYVVHNLGEKDIALGGDILRYLSQIFNTPFISSNVRFTGVSDIKIEPYLVKKIKIKNPSLKIKIGFLGILSPGLVEDDLSGEIEIMDPVLTLKPLVKRLKEETDLLILLSHTTEDEALEIASKFPEFNLIITGHGMDEPEHSVKTLNDTLIVSAGRYGKHSGMVKYARINKKWQVESESPDRKVKIVSLGMEYNNPSELDELLEEYKNIVRDEGLLAQHQKIPLNQGEWYTGNMTCIVCHINIFSHWKGTKHYAAYETLEKERSQFNPECVKCHVTGFDYSTGFESIDDTPDLKGVGCESCHGFGSIHTVSATDAPYGKVYEKNCLECHNPENSPRFEYTPYLDKIKHPVD